MLSFGSTSCFRASLPTFPKLRQKADMFVCPTVLRTYEQVTRNESDAPERLGTRRTVVFLSIPFLWLSPGAGGGFV